MSYSDIECACAWRCVTVCIYGVQGVSLLLQGSSLLVDAQVAVLGHELSKLRIGTRPTKPNAAAARCPLFATASVPPWSTARADHRMAHGVPSEY